MFVFTLGKSGLKRLAAVSVAGAALAAAVIAAGSIWKDRDAALAAAQPEKPDLTQLRVENTAGLEAFFHAFGLEIDLADTLVDKVKIPRKWDESFSAFNTVVKESSLSLEKHKGRTVEKWMVLCPSLCTGDQKAYGVVLVHRQQPVGAYLVHKPSGEVTGLVLPPAQPTAAALTEEEAAAAAAEFGSEAQQAAQANGAPAEPAPVFDAQALAQLEAQLAAAGAEPVE